MKYAIIPHRGKWDEASIATNSDQWIEPLLCSYHSLAELESKSFVDLQNTGYQVSSAQLRDGKIVLRLFNVEGENTQCKVTLCMPLSSVEEADLNGKSIERKKIEVRSGRTEMLVSMPRFGLKTFVLN